jgi:hypothetical protein
MLGVTIGRVWIGNQVYSTLKHTQLVTKLTDHYQTSDLSHNLHSVAW